MKWSSRWHCEIRQPTHAIILCMIYDWVNISWNGMHQSMEHWLKFNTRTHRHTNLWHFIHFDYTLLTLSWSTLHVRYVLYIKNWLLIIHQYLTKTVYPCKMYNVNNLFGQISVLGGWIWIITFPSRLFYDQLLTGYVCPNARNKTWKILLF